MGISDKITGRVKQAAGDLLGDEGIRRQGVDEERKADAKEELAREEERAARSEAKADEEAARAEERAEAAAERELEKADARVEREERKADAQRAAADERADEVDRLERRT
jgi:uncharacterized protein YjbJ (UPF0337 family)